jgi:hypothetical protein
VGSMCRTSAWQRAGCRHVDTLHHEGFAVAVQFYGPDERGLSAHELCIIMGDARLRNERPRDWGSQTDRHLGASASCRRSATDSVGSALSARALRCLHRQGCVLTLIAACTTRASTGCSVGCSAECSASSPPRRASCRRSRRSDPAGRARTANGTVYENASPYLLSCAHMGSLTSFRSARTSVSVLESTSVRRSVTSCVARL